MSWRSLNRHFPVGFRRRVQARFALAQAYRRLFSGHGSKADGEVVLSDLANHTGFYRVTEPGAGALDFAEGKRAVYGRVFRFLRMSDEEVASLEEAARAEALTDVREGEF